MRFFPSLLFSIVSLTFAASAGAQVVIAPTTPQIGSPNTVTADPPVPRPPGKPCVVSLFTNLEFADFNPKTFSYTPPSECKGPWAKVVFTADFTVTEGRQFDRTAAFYLGHANIYYGTTAEPRSTLSPSWHVERDVTDLSAVLKTAQSGEADLGNFVGVYNGVTYNGIIYANASLEFYPASWFVPAPETPDVVVPLPDAEGGAATLNATASQLTQSVTLPKNTERVYLDVITQSQSNDEFWYTCAPNDVASELQDCGNGPFREGEISIDGQPAGVAPVYPWIFTGGIDPYLWSPLPGVQTLNFKPYRIDLTPFAGVFADGNAHTIAISVFNADSYFLATANLLVYTDHFAKEVTGGILSNTLSAAPNPQTTENLTTSNGNLTGTIQVTSDRDFVITGYLNTSRGRVETTVKQTVHFGNTQTYNIVDLASPTTYVQDIVQATDIDAKTSTKWRGIEQTAAKHFEYPLVLDYVQTPTSSGGTDVQTTVQQRDLAKESLWLGPFEAFESRTGNTVNTTDTLLFDASGNFTGTGDRKSSQSYSSKDSLGYCYSRTLTSAAGLLTNVEDGAGCRR